MDFSFFSYRSSLYIPRFNISQIVIKKTPAFLPAYVGYSSYDRSSLITDISYALIGGFSLHVNRRYSVCYYTRYNSFFSCFTSCRHSFFVDDLYGIEFCCGNGILEHIEDGILASLFFQVDKLGVEKDFPTLFISEKLKEYKMFDIFFSKIVTNMVINNINVIIVSHDYFLNNFFPSNPLLTLNPLSLKKFLKCDSEELNINQSDYNYFKNIALIE